MFIDLSYDFSPWPPAAFFKYSSGLPFKLKGLSCFLMRSGTLFDGSKGFVLFSKEYKKSGPFSYRKKVRILLIWCISRDSNPEPTDQEKPTWNDRQFSKLRRFVVFIVLSSIYICCILCSCHLLLHPLSSYSGVQKVCKNVQSQNQPLKTGIGFFCKAGKTAGFEPDMAATISPV